MADEHTRRWRKHERAPTATDAIRLLRRAIVEIREAPGDGEARRRMRATAAEHELWETLAMLLADEARAHEGDPAVAAVFYEELADVHHALDQPIETIAAMEALIAIAPGELAHHERIAAFYRQSGAWAKAADAFEQVARRAPDEAARGALLEAARLHRDNRSFERAAALYRRLVDVRPADLLAWRALDDVLCELGRWAEVAEVRGERAARAESGLERAALLRAQARAATHAPAEDGELDRAPDDAAGPHELSEVRTPSIAEQATAEADALAASGRAAEAAEHLRRTLATIGDELPPAVTARLVHRCAVLTAALGDADESHQLLYEAQRLDRGSLAIALALGDSCFARRLWRQAALHLGGAAHHPEATRHAAAVAAALLRAAQAEVRALRPAHAAKHLEAAVRIDPGCAAAWHALAEGAIERGELARGAEYLEREAAATTDGRERARRFDALGDMALDVLADPARAERCWLQAATPAVLDKLLAVQRRRGATVERAATCEQLAAQQPDPAARKALLLEAAEALRAGGELARAVTVAEQLIELDPRDPESIVGATAIALAAGDAKRAATWARRFIPTGDADDRRAGLELVCAVGAPLTADDEHFLDAHPPRAKPSDEAYAAALDDDEIRELIDDPAEPPLRDVLALLGEVLPMLLPAAAAAVAGIDATRLPAASTAAAAAMYPQIARALGGPPTLLCTSPTVTEEAMLVPAAPPVVVFGPERAYDASLRFRLARIVELSRPHRVLAALPEAAFTALLAGLGGDALRARLPVAMRQRLADRLAAISPADLDAHAYIAACRRAADRAGLLMCGDVTVALELAGGAQRAPHLVRLAASRRYLNVRKKLRAR